MAEVEDVALADDAEAAERARKRAKIPPTAPLMMRFIHQHHGLNRKQRRSPEYQSKVAAMITDAQLPNPPTDAAKDKQEGRGLTMFDVKVGIPLNPNV